MVSTVADSSGISSPSGAPAADDIEHGRQLKSEESFQTSPPVSLDHLKDGDRRASKDAALAPSTLIVELAKLPERSLSTTAVEIAGPTDSALLTPNPAFVATSAPKIALKMEQQEEMAITRGRSKSVTDSTMTKTAVAPLSNPSPPGSRRSSALAAPSGAKIAPSSPSPSSGAPKNANSTSPPSPSTKRTSISSNVSPGVPDTVSSGSASRRLSMITTGRRLSVSGVSEALSNIREAWSAPSKAAGARDVLDSDITHGQELSDAALIEHFYPTTFPILPEISAKIIAKCRESWEHIKASSGDNGLSGKIWFYAEFNMRITDKSEKFESLFRGDDERMSKVLMLVMELCASIDVSNSKSVKRRLRSLGQMHRQWAIRPWMYATYAETLITTISVCLRDKATFETMNGWVHVLAYVLRYMLPHAVEGKIVRSECMTKVTYSKEVDISEISRYQALASTKRTHELESAGKMN